MKRTVSLILFAFSSLFLHAQTNNRIIDVDVSNAKGKLNKFFNECVGAGSTNEGLRADWQRQLRYAKEQCGFRYIRMHGLLHDNMGVYFEDKQGNPTYNWQYIDELYDFLLSIHVRPFVELSFMPKALASGDKTVFWWKANITPPKDYDKWGNLIKALVQHWTERYGHDEVKQWYFEVWNEPNLGFFWTGRQEGYFKLYNVTANAVKAVSKDYRVGGPATALHSWVPEFISYCSQNKVPVDFVSTHVYGVDRGSFDSSGGQLTYLSKKDSSIWGAVLGSRKQIAQSPFPNLELHYTEWSASYTPTDQIHDSYHEAAYILEKLKKTGDAANSMSYWTFTDIFEEVGIRATPFHGGFGLINYEDINKPAFYAYQFLNRLGNVELQNRDAASWTCKDEKGNVQVLLWDFTITQPDTVANQRYYARNLPAKPKEKVNINYKNLPAGKYELKVYQTGYKVNDAYTTYFEMGSPSQLTKQQVQTIKQKNNGAPVIQKTVVVGADKTFRETLDMRDNDVFLVTLHKL